VRNHVIRCDHRHQARKAEQEAETKLIETEKRMSAELANVKGSLAAITLSKSEVSINLLLIWQRLVVLMFASVGETSRLIERCSLMVIFSVGHIHI
jgi:hypothetical protein